MNLKKWGYSYLIICISILLNLFSSKRLPDEIQILWQTSIFPSFSPSSGLMSTSLFLVLFPSFMILFFILFLTLPVFNRKAFKRIETIYPMMVHSILLFFLLTQGFLLANGLGYPIEVSFYLLIAIGYLFIVLGNYIPRFRESLKQSYEKHLKNPDLFNRKVNTYIGRAFFYGGLLLVLAVFLPQAIRGAVALPLILAVSLTPAAIVLFQLNKHLRKPPIS